MLRTVYLWISGESHECSSIWVISAFIQVRVICMYDEDLRNNIFTVHLPTTQAQHLEKFKAVVIMVKKVVCNYMQRIVFFKFFILFILQIKTKSLNKVIFLVT